MFLVNFKISKNVSGDYKSVIWPVEYPYWLVREDEKSFWMRAYVEDFVTFNLMWPYAYIINTKEVDDVEYTDEFPKPAWYEPKYKFEDLFDDEKDDKMKNLVNSDLIDLLKLINEKVGISVDDDGIVTIGTDESDDLAEIEKCMQYLDYKNKYKNYNAKEILAMLKERDSIQYLTIVKRFYF